MRIFFMGPLLNTYITENIVAVTATCTDQIVMNLK